MYQNAIKDEVLSRIKMSEALRFYGHPVDRHGKTLCPFHKEKTPSLKTYADDHKFHCFGCGADGSVIDLVQMLFNLTFGQALVKLDNDFWLGLTNEDLSYRDKKKIEREQKERKEIDDYIKKQVELRQNEYDSLSQAHRIIYQRMVKLSDGKEKENLRWIAQQHESELNLLDETREIWSR